MPESLRILILEDNQADAELVQFELQEAGFIFTPIVVMTEKDYVHEIQKSCPDLILSDYDLPTYNGALALVEAKRICPDTPFILVTGAVSEDRAIEILTQGAKDYVLKSRLQQRLVPAVQRVLAEAAEHRARKQAEKELQEASHYSRTLIEVSLDPLVTISPEGRVMDVNKATEDVTGVSRKQIIGNDFSDYFTEPEKARAGYEKAFSEGSVKDYPLAIRHASGRITEVLYNATVYKNEKGEVQGVFAAARDITERKKVEEEIRESHRNMEERVKVRTIELEAEMAERKRAEESLKESDERQRFALETCHIGAWDLDLIDHSAHRSLEHDRIFGYANLLSHWTYEMFLDHVLPEDREMVDGHFQHAIENKSDWSFECRIRRPDGDIRWIWAIGRHKVDTNRELRRMVGIVQDITERKQAEKKLMNSEQKFRTLAECSPFAIMMHQGECWIYANPAAEEISGYTKEELYHMPFWDFVHPDYRDMVKQRGLDRQQGKVPPHTYEFKIITKNGKEKWVSLTANPIQYEDKPIVLISGIDISERRWTEGQNEQLLHSIQEEKDRLKALINSTNDEIWFADTQKRFTLMNPSALSAFDLHTGNGIVSVSKLTENLEVYRPDGSIRPVEEAPPLRALEGEVVRNQEEIVRTPATDMLRYRQVSSNPVRNAMGQIIGSVSIVRDITEQKLVEEKLRKSEHLYRAIGESIDYGIWICDTEGRNIYASESFLKLVGMTQEQCSNFGWGDTLHPDDTERTIAAWKECVRIGGIWNIEHRFRGVDGEWHSVLARGVPVRNEQSEVIFWAGINLDISDLKKAEISLKERTQQLEVTNKELESFSYSVSHDLRTPLRAIDGYTRMILRDQRDKLNDDAKRKFDLIRSNTQMMGKLIDDLLSFSRLGRLEINMSKLDMEGLANDAWMELQIINPDRMIDCKIKNIPPGWGDRTLIKQVYSNLLSNAVKYTKVKDKAYIETGGHEEGNENIYYIKDNGVGFDMEYYDKLFGVFQRLHSADDYEGTGVGLAIVQRIIHRHGGRVWAESKVEEGAIFYFSLPVKDRY